MAAEPRAVSEDAVLGGTAGAAPAAARPSRSATMRYCSRPRLRREPGEHAGRPRRRRRRGGLGAGPPRRGSRGYAGRDRSGAGGAGRATTSRATDLPGGCGAVCLDVAAPPAAFAAAGLVPESADHVLMNPPFNCAAVHLRPIPAAGSLMPPTENTLRGLAWRRGAAASPGRHDDTDLARGRTGRRTRRRLRRVSAR